MKTIRVQGKRKNHKVLVYALSTCVWCSRTKDFLKKHEVEYEFIDVDLSSSDEKQKIIQDIMKRGVRLSYPIIIIDDEITIQGFRTDEIKGVLGL
jgi:glutaredoxin